MYASGLCVTGDVLFVLVADSVSQMFNFAKIYDCYLRNSKKTENVLIISENVKESFWLHSICFQSSQDQPKNLVSTPSEPHLTIGATTFGIYAYLGTISFLYSEFDPLFQFQENVLPLILPDWTVAWAFSLPVQSVFIIPAFQICHISALVFCMITTVVYIFLSCVSSLNYSARMIFLNRDFATEILLVNDVLHSLSQSFLTKDRLWIKNCIFLGNADTAINPIHTGNLSKYR